MSPSTSTADNGLHQATFTWPSSHHSHVFVTGTFDSWSGNTHALIKQDDGSFKGQVGIKAGEKVAYKYVCDGQWMTREDEDKEWDAAGNMNNVYTAPAAPVAPVEKHEEVAPVAAAAATTTAPVEKHDEAATSSLVAAQAPGVASTAIATDAPSTTGANTYGYELGAPVAGGEQAVAPTTTTANTTNLVSTAGPITPEGALAAIKRDEPPAASTAENATATTTEDESSSSGISHTAAAWGAGAIAGITAAAGGLVLAAGDAVHAVTGLDVVHPDPVSVEEAKAKGINTEELPAVKPESTQPAASVPVPHATGETASAPSALKREEPTTTTTPSSVAANSLPAPVSAHTDAAASTSATSEKVSDVVTKAKEDAQRQLNGHVPQPAVVSMPSATSTSTSDRTPASQATASGKDTTPDHFASNDPSAAAAAATRKEQPTPKHSLPAQSDTKEANHQHVPQPVINTISPPLKDRTKPESEDVAGKPVSTNPADSPAEYLKQAKNDVFNNNGRAAEQEPSRSYIKKQEPAAALPLQTTRVPTTGEDAPAKLPPVPPAAATAAPVTPTATAPATPVKTQADLSKRFSTASPSSTAPSTPATKHGKEGTSDSDTMRKRKSSFFSKMKNVFHKKEGSQS